jgi:putative addiction module killer protein
MVPSLITPVHCTTQTEEPGLSELRMFFGPGYRVYFGEEGDNIVLLLCGGDKSSQAQDIEAAKAYWKEHLSHG